MTTAEAIREMTTAYQAAKRTVEKAQEAEHACALALFEVAGKGHYLGAQWIRAFRSGAHGECSRLIKLQGWAREGHPGWDDAPALPVVTVVSP
jgi:hypothetical protein